MVKANTNPDPLANLRDIHLPPDISLWPLTPAWYVLGLLLLMVVSYGIYKFIHYRRKTRVKRAALQELKQLKTQYIFSQKTVSTSYQPHSKNVFKNWMPASAGMTNNIDFLLALSTLVRRTALACFPKNQIAGLTGKAWQQFLIENGQFETHQAELLTTLPYQSSQKIDLLLLLKATEEWTERLKTQN